MKDEYIRKADAKDALQEKVFHNLTDEFYGAMQAIDELSSADVAPVRHGTWLPTNDENKKRCNKCDTVVLIAMYPNGNANFCPNCGAKMRGEQE